MPISNQYKRFLSYAASHARFRVSCIAPTNLDTSIVDYEADFLFAVRQILLYLRGFQSGRHLPSKSSPFQGKIIALSP